MSLTGLLGVGAGASVYHFLVILALGAMAVISFLEWRHTSNPDHRRIVWAFAGLLVPRILLLVLESASLPITAPLVNWMEAASLALLGWAFLAPVLSRLVGRLYLGMGIGVTFLFAIILWPSWYSQLAQVPTFSYLAFWQQPIWYVLDVLLALAPALLLLLRRQREEHWMVMVGFAVLCVGSVVLSGSSLLFVTGNLKEVTYSDGIGWGRLINLLGYSLFAVVVYRIAMQDMWTYQQELQTMSEEALRQAKELFFLVETSRAIGESLDLDAILRRVVESAAMALDADRAAIFLVDPERAGMIILAAQYIPLQRAVHPAERPALPLSDQPTLDYALQRGKQLLLNVETDNPRLRALYGLLGGRKAGPTIVQPLIRQERVLGALIVGNDYSQKTFEVGQGRLCQSIAAQVTAAIENARLYRDLQAKAAQLAELLQTQEDEVRRRMAILESIADGVIVGDREGRVITANVAAERILGVSRERLLGRLFDRLTGQTALAPQADWGKIAQSDMPLQSMLELEGKVVYVSAAPVLTPSGDRMGVVAVLRDITREVESERSKSEFITSVSHELRTPLTAIRGYAEALSGGMVGPMSEAQAHFLDIICDNAIQMGSLAENLIAVAELEQGGVKLEFVDTDLHLVVGEVVASFKSELEDRQLELVLKLDDALPLIEADSVRVRQILDNLVSNAVKFTYPGGCVTVGAELVGKGEEQEGPHCVIWVEDTGIGISPEEQAHIWERFYRPSNPLAVEASGLGVGLSIVKSLAEAHNGRVWLESTPGMGSKFTVLLPVKRTQPLPAPSESPAAD